MTENNCLFGAPEPMITIPLELLSCIHTSLAWMIATVNYQNALSGMNTEKSPELKAAEQTLMIVRETLEERING